MEKNLSDKKMTLNEGRRCSLSENAHIDQRWLAHDPY